MAASLDRLLLLLLLATPLLSQIATTADSSTTTPCIEKGDMKECVNATIVQPEGKSVTFDKEDLQQDVIDQWTASKIELMGRFYFTATKHIKYLNFPRLKKINELYFLNTINLETIEFPVLEHANDLVFYENPSLKSIYINPKAEGGIAQVTYNPQLCDEGLVERFNFIKLMMHSNCEAICDTHELHNFYDADRGQLLKCRIFRNTKIPIEEGLLNDSLPKLPNVTGIQGKVELKGTKLPDLILLQNIEEIDSKHDLALEIVDNKELDQIDLPKLKTLKSNGRIKLRIRGNKKLLDKDVYEKLKEQLGLKDEEIETDYVVPTTTTTTTTSPSTSSTGIPAATEESAHTSGSASGEDSGSSSTGKNVVPTATTTPSSASTGTPVTTEGSSGAVDNGEEASNMALGSGSASSNSGSSSTGKKVGIAIGIVIALLVLLGLVAFLVYWFVIRKKQQKKAQERKTEIEKKAQTSTEQAPNSGLARGEEMKHHRQEYGTDYQ